MLHVIAYDIQDDRARTQVVHVLEGYGQRVQGSVFECWLTRTQLDEIQRQLVVHIDPVADRVRYYALCRKDVEKVQWDGRGSGPADTIATIV
ncbi:MAG: CRISPR-associated endonuclease Cas2 [Gammaproteobacteria bacterium]|nr:CRISPR-associated endonuclease Cas2 [Gammaproteobacteria bacterium]MBU1653549.1 CRISPR-associated endonuclease Cas2 [Gammaproteobacteria bacterium]MBU1961891.1 CRISPR-associated endonuclease Cas2 [Gammaproteobacteria bacterium]